MDRRAHRATRDVDLLGFGEPSEEHIRTIFEALLTLDVPDDGVKFDIDTLSVGPIREDQAYGGLRAVFVARITSAKIELQVDIGFGDAITPEPEVLPYPGLLDFPAPQLRVYPRETVVAEKLEAMVQLGMTNSRMKDFYDVMLLARDFDFDGESLVEAIRATFERRKTPLPEKLPVAIRPEFTEDSMKLAQWQGFKRKADIQDADSLESVVRAVADFASQPLLQAHSGRTFGRSWRAGGPWTSEDT
ncbi:MAG: nucleotidyl transferase AbiEii/AbiGii toxin family protein [Myxococcales bacterium]|nr:MAG: nucleotidyl transferase AbiEii/AbiGii toxin family protein [Myxococcales bacterium]